MEAVKSSIQTLDNSAVEQIEPGRAANPANVKRVESILKEADWDYLFPMRAPEYTYSNFLKAIGKFPAVCGTYTDGRDSDAICRKTPATVFAHFARETGGHESWRDIPEWRQALVYLREVGWTEGQKGGYNGECNPDVWQGQTGRAVKIRTAISSAILAAGQNSFLITTTMGLSLTRCMATFALCWINPSWWRIRMNPASAVFFFVYPQPPKPSMLHVIDGTGSQTIAIKQTARYQVSASLFRSSMAAWSAAAQMRMRSRLTASPTTKSLPTT